MYLQERGLHFLRKAYMEEPLMAKDSQNAVETLGHKGADHLHHSSIKCKSTNASSSYFYQVWT